MLGLAVMFVGLLYFILLCVVTVKAYRAAIRNNKTPKVARRYGLAGFLIIFLPVFWDFIPNKVMYSYYCHYEAGFFQYKTILCTRQK